MTRLQSDLLRAKARVQTTTTMRRHRVWSLDHAVDQAIAEDNRRFLADPKAITDAQREGTIYRLRLEMEGILPKLNPERDWTEAELREAWGK